jgi:enoyl-CoA hydratase/carnithine racemase
MAVTAEANVAGEIRCALDEGVLEVEIHRPGKRNALTPALYQGLADAMDRASGEEAVRVVLLLGHRDVFTSGNDISDFLQRPPGLASPGMRFLERILAQEKPIVAGVNGMAVGIGTTMLLHCDHVVAGEGAVFAVPFVNLGLCPEAASSLLLPAVVGHKRASEMLLFGERIPAARALEWGLVNQVVADGEVRDVARGRARALAAKPAGALRMTKALLKRRFGELAAERMQEEGREFARLLHEPAAREALAAFVEKRNPDPEKYR